MVKLFCSNYWQNPQITAAVHYSQKQFCKKMYSVKVRKYHRKIPVLESVFNKVAGLRACNFITKKLQHWCFSVKSLFGKTSANNCFYTFIITLIIIFTFITFITIRRCRSQIFYKIAVLKYFANFTGKHLCWSLFLIKR